MNTITSTQNSLVKHLTKLRSSRSYRYQENHLVIAGNKIVRETLLNNTARRLIISDSKSVNIEGLFYEELLYVSDNVIKKISGQENPEPILAEIAMPQISVPKNLESLLILDGIADPGNIGTLIRTALALGWETIFLLNKTVDPFNDKAIRAAKGATFRIPIITGDWESLKKIIDNHNLQLLVADMDGEITSCHTKPALLLSNESHGAKEEALRQGKRISIPMSGSMESLNVAIAGSILMYTTKGNHG